MTNRSIGYYVRHKGKTQWLYRWALGTPDLLEVFLWIGWMKLDESSSEYVAFTEGTGFEKVTVEQAEALHAGSTSHARRAAKAYGNAAAKTGGDGLAAFSLRPRQPIGDDPPAVVDGARVDERSTKMTKDAWAQYAEHRTRDELNKLLHYGHIIPVSRGFTDAYVAKHFPGWHWNSLMAIWKAAGIVVRSPAGGPPWCDPEVVAIHFNGPDSFAVEWVDGTVTTA